MDIAWHQIAVSHFNSCTNLRIFGLDQSCYDSNFPFPTIFLFSFICTMSPTLNIDLVPLKYLYFFIKDCRYSSLQPFHEASLQRLMFFIILSGFGLLKLESPSTIFSGRDMSVPRTSMFGVKAESWMSYSRYPSGRLWSVTSASRRDPFSCSKGYLDLPSDFDSTFFVNSTILS